MTPAPLQRPSSRLSSVLAGILVLVLAIAIGVVRGKRERHAASSPSIRVARSGGGGAAASTLKSEPPNGGRYKTAQNDGVAAAPSKTMAAWVPQKAAAEPNIAILLGELNDPARSLSNKKQIIKDLAVLDSPEAASALGQVLTDPSRPDTLRVDAAQALGAMNQPGASAALAQAALTIRDNDIVSEVLNALGSRDFTETQAFFQNYLHSPNIPSEMRVAAIEALSQAQGDPTTLLVALADDGDTDVRAAAAWALSATGDSGASGPQLLSLVGNETDPGVRARLYQALENQDGLDSNTLLAAVRNEQDPTARIAALDLLAHALRENPTPELENFFEQTAIPQLRQIALSGGDSQTRMSAVIALARGNNLSAQTALREIGQTSADPKIRNAADSAIGILAKK